MNDQNERFEDREIKMLYRDNAQRTAPDMEKLWSRIESEIDKTDAVPQRTIVQTKKTTNNKTMIRAIISCAATFIIVFGITAVIARNSASPDKSSERDFRSESRMNAADNTNGAETLTGGSIVSKADSITYNEGTKGAEEAEEAEQSDKTDRKSGEKATDNGLVRDSDDPVGETDGAAYSSPASEAQRSEQQTAEADSSPEYTVLSRTTAFLDAKVISTEQNGDSCTYTLETLKTYGRNGTTEGGEVKLEAEIPLGLTVGEEYLIPVTEDETGIHPALYREAQIMFTGDGRIRFPVLWTALAEGAEDTGDGFMAVTADRTEKLIEKWRNS